jgi:hypothetical protein
MFVQVYFIDFDWSFFKFFPPAFFDKSEHFFSWRLIFLTFFVEVNLKYYCRVAHHFGCFKNYLLIIFRPIFLTFLEKYGRQGTHAY